MKMKTTVIIAGLIIGSVLLCLQADAGRLLLEEAKRVRGEANVVKPSLVPAKSAMNGDGMTADQVNTNNSQEKNESDEDEASNGQGLSGDSTHHMFPDQPPIHGH